ncbi:MAG TPA: AraC family transcriptional regulator [Puia sp.]|jgi:AraC-like DNA-binding protein
MKSPGPLDPKTDPASYWSVQPLPVGLKIACTKIADQHLELSLPDFAEAGMVLSFIHYKGDLQIVSGKNDRRKEHASPSLGLLSIAGQSFRFQSSGPINFSAIALFIPDDWIGLFLKENAHFQKIEQVLDEDENIITCRLGRRQQSLFSAILGQEGKAEDNALEIQNHALSLLEYFLCNRHRSILGANASSGIDNEDDLSLIREVESYISEYYCSDTFTVDSILKKTYTSYHRLNFLFKSIHGMTISEYIRNKRIEKSKEMIAANAKSISQIAYEIGYSSISNYILAFKKIYRITPGKYKKQMEA